MPENPEADKMRGYQIDITRFLSKIYDDNEIAVSIAPDDRNLEDLILDIVRSRGSVTLKDLKIIFSGISSEDRIKRAINRLARNNKIYLDVENGTVYTAEI